MKASEVKLTDLDALIASDRETDGKPVLPEGCRERVQGELELMIIWPEALQRHVRELLHGLSGSLRHSELLPEEMHELIVEAGLSVLDDAALAALALNPVALCAIHGWWYGWRGEIPEAWQLSIRRRSDVELDEKGLGWLNRMLRWSYEEAERRGWKPGMPSPFGPTSRDPQ